MKKLFILILTILFLAPSIIFAHPGRTDSNGCHTCKTNCPEWGLETGEYHCHATKVKTETKHYSKRSAK
ncbi:YHYH domain-containing protein [Candidatus Falkowbacteria bacterium]|nr:YHYH domain-containing protein [Candidatus Falkowbacteria bacterium]